MLKPIYWQLLASAIVAVVAQTAPAAAQNEEVLHSFLKGKTDGNFPTSHLVLSNNKKTLYGTTEKGGIFKSGTVFALTNSGDDQWSESLLYSFSGSPDGRYPKAGLVEDSSGTLYGTTQYGGTDNSGAVFELKLSQGAWKEQILYSFPGDGSGGSHPFSELLPNNKTGALYGTTYDGGTANCGVVFQLAKSGKIWVESVLYSLSGSAGCHPEADLREDPTGNLYGSALTGQTSYGSVFMLSPTGGTWTPNVLHNFTGGSDGAYPWRIGLSSAGIIYGVTFSGGSQNDGTVFELTQAGGSWTNTVIHNFTGSPDGSDPYGIRLDTKTGDLYGTTEYGGMNNLGTVFQMIQKQGVWTETVLHSFAGGSDGALPEASPAENAKTKAIYGTTTEGGSKNAGTVYTVTP